MGRTAVPLRRSVPSSLVGLASVAGACILLLLSCSQGLGVVTSMTTTPNGTSLNLSWSPESGVSGYQIFLSQSPSVSPTNYTSEYTSSTSNYTITGLTIGVTYYIVIVPMALGGLAIGPPSSAVAAALPGYVYNSNPGASSLSVFTIGAGGALSFDSYVATGSQPYSVAVSPNNAYVYTANIGASNVSAYSIGPGGALTQIPGQPYSVSIPALGLAFSPTGAYLYVSEYEVSPSSCAAISAFSVGSNGALSPLTGSPYNYQCWTAGTTPPAGEPLYQPYGVAVSPDGAYLYVADNAGNAVSTYKIGAGGVPTWQTNTSVGSGPWAIAISPNGAYLYVTNAGSGTVSGFSIGSGGVLSPLSSPTFPAGSSPNGITITPSGNYLYVANVAGNSISGYSIGSNGLLSPISGSPFNIGSGPVEVAVSSDGRYVYSDNSNGTVTGFAIGSNGALALPGVQAPTGAGPWGIAVTH